MNFNLGPKWRPPVDTEADRLAITVGPNDEGLSVFVMDTNRAWIVSKANPVEWTQLTGAGARMEDNPYFQYIQEKDPINNYEVAQDIDNQLAIAFVFRKLPNMNYWNRVIIPELKRMAEDFNQCIIIERDIDCPLSIDILRPGETPRQARCRK